MHKVVYNVYGTNEERILLIEIGGIVMNDDIMLARQKLEEAKRNYEEGKYNNTVAYCNQVLEYVRFSSDADIKKEVYYLLGLAHLKLGTVRLEKPFSQIRTGRP